MTTVADAWETDPKKVEANRRRLTMKYEVTNIEDGLRMSRVTKGNSTTLFDSEKEANAWIANNGLSKTHEAKPAK